MVAITHVQKNSRSLISDARQSLREIWENSRGYQKFAYLIGVILIASSLFHLVVIAIEGSSWAGPISWRKPITFGVSFGITTISMAWVMEHLPKKSWLGWLLLLPLVLGSFVEVFLVSIQQWRGVPSHFNNTTPFDATVFSLMGMSVVFIALSIVLITTLAVFTLRTTRDMRIAILVGLVLLIAGNYFGSQIIANGQALQEANLSLPLNIFGEAGWMKVPHGVAMHAIQALPILVWLGTKSSWADKRRRNAVIAASIGYTGLLAVSAMQTFAGLAPFDLGLVALVSLVISLILLAVPFGRVGLDLLTRD